MVISMVETVIKKKHGDRDDARLVRNLPQFNQIFPYIMPTREASSVYFTQQIRIENARKFLHELNKRENASYTLFNLVLASIVRTLTLRPRANRFVVGNRLYSRDNIVITFVTKQGRTEKTNEVILRVPFERTDTLQDVTRKAKEYILKARKAASVVGEDKVIRFFLHFPRCVINWVVRTVMWLDRFDKAPRSILKIDPMRASAFVSDQGSYDMGAPFHHTYDWGDSSLFLVMGAAHKVPVVTDDDKIEIGEVVDFAYTVDERISDGYYYSTVVHTFENIMLHPEQLLAPPENIPTDL